MAFSSLKVNEESGDLMMRWYNMKPDTSLLSLAATEWNTNEEAYKSNILEEKGEKLVSSSNVSTNLFSGKQWSIPAGPCEIVTVGLPR